MKIKKGMEEEYKEYVDMNSQDPYSKCVIDAGEAVGKLLDEGVSPEQAEKGMNGFGLTGFMAGAVASAMINFHPRGEEFKKWWNKELGGTGEEESAINPAIFTIKDKEE